MRIAIIGGGFGVSGHLPAFTAMPEVQVVVVADSGSGRVRSSLLAGVDYAASWQEALSKPIDAVSIVVPPAYHLEIVSAALSLKKHVFCDKPFGLNLKEAEVMNAKAVEQIECITAINFQFRFEPGIQELKRQIEAGTIGVLHSIDFSWITAGRVNPQSLWTWRNDHSAGGGVIGAFFSHAADLIWWLSQKEPLTIFGQSRIMIHNRQDELGQRRKVTAEDMVTAQLNCEDGVTASFRVSNCQEGGNGMRLEVRGSDGVMIYRHEPPFKPEDQRLTFAAKGQKREMPISKPYQYMNNADTRIWAILQSANQFVRKVHGDANTCLPSFYDGLRVHKIMDGLRKSAVEGESIIL
jgi:predicted dehydrogenase